MAVDLITASFDVLAANTSYRNETNETIFSFRSFLVNKVPTLVAMLAGSMFPTTTPELCITQALNHIDRNAFPSFSQTFDMAPVNSLLSDVRQDFLVACALHQLIPESSIERLLGETPMSSVPVGGKYIKENLVAQCSTNFERVEELLNEIEGMDGNAGAIVGAMIEVCIPSTRLGKEHLTLIRSFAICAQPEQQCLSRPSVVLCRVSLVLSMSCYSTRHQRAYCSHYATC